MHNDETDGTLHTFRGRTMQEAVARLKARLGPDAVIVKTHRGDDPRGRFVEITAMGPEPAVQPPPAPPPVRSGSAPATARGVAPKRNYADVDDDAAPAMGGRQGASAAYARVARTVAPTPAAPGRPVPADEPAPESRWARAAAAAAARHGVAPPAVETRPAPAANPFAERAALLARQITAPAVAADASDRVRAEIAGLRDALENLTRRPADAVTEATLERVAGALADEIQALRALMTARTETEKTERLPVGVRVLRDRLAGVGIGALHADELARRASPALERGTPDDAEVLALVGRELTRDMKCAGDLLPTDGRRRVLAFVGPTGVGKTTTIAKIAAEAQLVRRLRVGLVTVDTFRIAAVEQLARYAEILECPLVVVKQPDELADALDTLADCDVILVDTTGRSPRAADQVAALTRFFPAGWGGDIVLTLAASTRERDLHAAVDAFDALDFGYLCVTKLDETDALGGVYSLARRAGRPLAWLSAGQRVPEDLEVADQTTLAARIVTGSTRTRTSAESLAS
jgi:flagellar biosynthesis protein FlhF